jgi:DNA phosphorothioation-dependent restriction protein DptG
MTKLLEKAFQEVQKLSDNLQNEIAQQLLIDIENELKWQETLADPDINLDVLSKMAQAALIEDQEGKTEAKGFGEE